jgi:hypothetical protein
MRQLQKAATHAFGTSAKAQIAIGLRAEVRAAYGQCAARSPQGRLAGVQAFCLTSQAGTAGRGSDRLERVDFTRVRRSEFFIPS